VPKDTSAKTNSSSPNPEPAASRSSAPASQSVESPKTLHSVKSGESLGSIAAKYHCSIAELMKWNNLSSQKILVGQKIKVVANSKTSAANVKPDTITRPKTSQRVTSYTIQSGDNLWDIADKFDVTVSQLKTYNNLKNNSRLKPGQKLKIPK
jgi:LysM repeat protein